MNQYQRMQEIALENAEGGDPFENARGRVGKVLKKSSQFAKKTKKRKNKKRVAVRVSAAPTNPSYKTPASPVYSEPIVDKSDEFENDGGTDVEEMAEAVGVNAVMASESDYDYVNAGGFSKMKAKLKSLKDKGLLDKISKGGAVVASVSDALKKKEGTSATPETIVAESPTEDDNSKKKKLILYSGIVAALIVAGIVIFKVIKNKQSK